MNYIETDPQVDDDLDFSTAEGRKVATDKAYKRLSGALEANHEYKKALKAHKNEKPTVSFPYNGCKVTITPNGPAEGFAGTIRNDAMNSFLQFTIRKRELLPYDTEGQVFLYRISPYMSSYKVTSVNGNEQKSHGEEDQIAYDHIQEAVAILAAPPLPQLSTPSVPQAARMPIRP